MTTPNNSQENAASPETTIADCSHPEHKYKLDLTKTRLRSTNIIVIPGECTNCGLEIEQQFHAAGTLRADTGDWITL